MKKLFKKLALMVVALLTFSVGSNYTVKEVKAADTKIVFDFGAKGSAAHVDGNAYSGTKNYTSGTYTLSLTSLTKVYGPAYDAKGNSCIKLGTSSATGSFKFTVPEDVDSVEIEAAKYKTNTTKLTVNSKAYTLTKNSNNGEYDVITVDTSSTKTVSFATASGGVRCMVNTITYVISDDGDSGEPEVPVERTDEEKVDASISAFATFDMVSKKEFFSKTKTLSLDLEDKENETEISYTLTGDTDVFSYNQGVLTVSPVDSLKTATLTVTFTSGSFSKPITFTFNSWLENTILTLEEANIIGNLFDKDTYTEGKYYINCVIDEVYNTTYGNMYVHDENVDKFTIYGTYSADGEKRYDALTEKPIAGDSIKVYGVIGKYNDPQMKNGWIVEHKINATNQELIKMVETTASLAFDYTYDEVEETVLVPATEATLTFDDKAKRTEYSTSKQVWSENGVTFTNEKGASTTNIGDYSAPVRIYKNSNITIEVSAPISKIIFDSALNESGDNKTYLTFLKSSIGEGNYEVDSNKENLIICNLDKSSNTYSLKATAGQIRFNSITVFYGDDTEVTTTTKDFSNSKFDDVSILFGAEVDASLFKDFTSVTAGVMFSAGDELKVDIAKKFPVESLVETNGVYSVGAVLEVFAEGDIVNDDTKDKLSQNITAAVYFVVDGETLVLESKTVSVASMVETYLTEYKNDVKEHEEALKALKSYIEA